MSRTTARLALAFSLAGLAASGVAAYTHYRLLTDQSYLSFCDISATVSCSDAYSSRFGSVGGVSVAVFGMLWFALASLLSAAAIGARPSVRENVPGYLFAGSTLALSVILYLGYASFFVLNVVCVVCLATYAATIGLFVVSGATAKVPMTTLPGRAAADVKVLASSPLAVTLAAVFVVGAMTTLAWFPREGPEGAPPGVAEAAGSTDAPPDRGIDPEFLTFYLAQPRVTLDVPADGARVLVVKFNDFQCPACGQSYQEYKSILARYEAEQPGAVRLVLKDFPLEPECNAQVSTNLHPAACEAAVAIRLAPEDRAAALEEWLYSNQPSMTPESVREAASQIGQVQDFDSRYAITLEAVRADIAYGRQLGIRSTPTFFINGTKLEGALPAQYFDQAIAFELERASSP